MIRDAHETNATVAPTDFEVARLRAALPEYFDKDGGFMLDRLQDALRAGEVNLTREGYELKFLGKSYAKYLTSTRTETVVVPDLEHNAEGANAESGNLYIVGDNIDALKHLLGSYSGQVKCIYIDPPYNTGSDGFVYVDDFGFTVQELVRKIGLSEDEAKRVIDLQGKSSHSAWLTFMYPRLELAKQLLADDGVIFISIDDNEQTNLKALCDEVFGEQNAVANLVWKSKSGGAERFRADRCGPRVRPRIREECRSRDSGAGPTCIRNDFVQSIRRERPVFAREARQTEPDLLGVDGLRSSRT